MTRSRFIHNHQSLARPADDRFGLNAAATRALADALRAVGVLP